MNETISSHYAELYHHGVKGMKWGVRRYQNKDGSLTEAGKKRVYKTVAKYAKELQTLHTTEARTKVEEKIKAPFRDHILSCKDAVGKQWTTMKRMHEYQEPYLEEWGRLKDVYLSKHEYLDTADGLTDKVRETIKRQAAKTTGYDENEYKKLRSDWETARDNAERECKKVADNLLGKYGNTPLLNEGYANEQKARDIVSNILFYSNWNEYRNRENEWVW